MKKVEVIIEYADNNLSAYVKDAPVMAVGNTIEEIENNIRGLWSFILRITIALAKCFAVSLNFALRLMWLRLSISIAGCLRNRL